MENPTSPANPAPKKPECNESEVRVTEAAEDNPFAYLESNGFTSEIYKIEIKNLPKYYGIGELKKLLLKKLKLNCNKVKTISRNSKWAFACFRSEEDRKKALNLINNYKWKGSTLTAKVANPAPDPYIQRKNEQRQKSNNHPKTIEEQREAIKRTATPFADIPYLDQVSTKTEHAKDVLKKLAQELLMSNNDAKEWLTSQMESNDGLPCKLFETRCLPLHCDGYRNKCEFTIGKNELTGERTIGFRLGTYASGTVEVVSVESLKHIPPRMLNAVQVFEKYIRSSKYDVFSPDTWTGYWKQLTVRLGMKTDQLLLIVVLHPYKLSNEELEEVKQDLVTFFKSGDGAALNCTSVYLQLLVKKAPGVKVPEAQHLLGAKSIQEELCGLKFKISPDSFFQINSHCSEVLMSTVKELAGVNQDTTLLDVCCGTGVIGLCLAKDAGQVLGLEIVEPAVVNARENAVANGILNSEFFCGNAEEIISSVVTRSKFPNIVAVVDPPRAGLTRRAVKMLRRTNNLQKIVFLACNPNAAYGNFVDLGRNESRSLVGTPYLPVSAVVVDMFPHTEHFEMVIYFERFDVIQSKFKKDPDQEMKVD